MIQNQDPVKQPFLIPYRKGILGFFAVLTILSLIGIPRLKFSFDFEQFFPQGDEDLEFFRSFTKEFETDDNFLLLAVENNPTVFDTSFLQKFHTISLDLRSLPYVKSVQGLTTMRYPVKTPFGITSIPILHLANEEKLERDKERILDDPRFVNNLINKEATALVSIIKTKGGLSVYESEKLIEELHNMMLKHQVSTDDYHALGRAYFQESLIKNQQKEVLYSSIVSIILVALILFFIFRRTTGIIIALTSISISLILFIGFMAAFGRPLSIMSALYPVLMLIVGTSDVIHLMTKYVDEIQKGLTREEALKITIKQIGIATFLTSLTTAIGFATLLTSRLEPVRDFGINSAVGVIIAFITTMLISSVLLSYFPPSKIIDVRNKHLNSWSQYTQRLYELSKKYSRYIVVIFTIAIVASLYGLTEVTTNYTVENNLPIGEKVTSDFLFFEEEFSGFRPLEFAIIAKPGYQADQYEVIREINKIEEHLIQIPEINSVISPATFYKSVSRMNKGNARNAYLFPSSEGEFYKSKKMIDKVYQMESTVLINKKRDKTRISSKISDIGADSIKIIGGKIDQWIASNVDTSILSVKRTGTGLIMDKNSVYVTESLIKGLGLALLIISIVMAILLKSWKMLILAFIPNILPVLFAGALLGFLNIELEAGISIVFAVIFGIAVDDTIHFLSKYKLCRSQNFDIEESLRITFNETGKAIFFTTVILFFGFVVMLFSSSPPTRTVGGLISITLIAALLSDVLLLPILMRKWLKK